MATTESRSSMQRAARQPAVWATILLTIAALAALTAPASGNPAARVALALILGGAVMGSVSLVERSGVGVMAGAASVTFGVLLRLDAARYGPLIMLTVAGLTVGIGVVVGLRMKRAGFAVPVALATTALIGATGWLFVAYETQLLPLGFGLIGLLAAIVTAIGTTVLGSDSTGSEQPSANRIEVADAWRAAGRWIGDRIAAAETGGEADEVAAKLFHEGPERRRDLIRFYALMGFASIIASFGVLTDSTAVVIIALVPPLAVVGVATQLGDWDSAQGALLLFVTNALAIVAMGALTFVLTGIAGSGGASRGKVGNWVVSFAAAGVVVVWGLVETSSAVNEQGALTSIVRSVTDDWADDLGYEVDSVSLDGTVVTVEITGPDSPEAPSVDELADALSERLGVVTVELRTNIQTRTVVGPDR